MRWDDRARIALEITSTFLFGKCYRPPGSSSQGVYHQLLLPLHNFCEHNNLSSQTQIKTDVLTLLVYLEWLDIHRKYPFCLLRLFPVRITNCKKKSFEAEFNVHASLTRSLASGHCDHMKTSSIRIMVNVKQVQKSQYLRFVNISQTIPDQ